MIRPHRANGRAAWRLALASLAMFAFGYALVPLYDAFFEVTGLGGKITGQAGLEGPLPGVDTARNVKVELDPARPKHITTVTLSNTFFRAPEKETAQLTRGQARDS